MKSTLVRKKIGDKTHVPTQEGKKVKIVTEDYYKTNGESLIIVKETPSCNLYLDSSTTNSITVKSMSKVIIHPNKTLIDEFYETLLIEKGACVVLEYVSGYWYIISSDGLKLN
jgi:hypothetical protein